MGAYDVSKSMCLSVSPWGTKDSFGIKLAGGMVSGMVGAAIANPADLVSSFSGNTSLLTCDGKRTREFLEGWAEE